MANFSTWLLTIFMVMFWLFRAIVALCTQYSIDLLGIVSYDFNMEVIIAFITLPCIILIVKRKIAGSLIYLAMYAIYFGEHLFKNLVLMSQGSATLTQSMSMNLLCDMIAIVLALFVLMDILVDKGRKANPVDKKTDWYFKNEKYDKELEERDKREDKNQYKFY